DFISRSTMRNAIRDEETAAEMPSYWSCHTILYRERRRHLPPNPKTADEINVVEQFAHTLSGENFLQADDSTTGHRILVFSSETSLKRICCSSTCFGDGTFKSCPAIFYQLYIISG